MLVPTLVFHRILAPDGKYLNWWCDDVNSCLQDQVLTRLNKIDWITECMYRILRRPKQIKYHQQHQNNDIAFEERRRPSLPVSNENLVLSSFRIWIVSSATQKHFHMYSIPIPEQKTTGKIARAYARRKFIVLILELTHLSSELNVQWEMTYQPRGRRLWSIQQSFNIFIACINHSNYSQFKTRE